MTKHPVTIAEFRKCLDAGHCSTPADDTCHRVGGGALDGPNLSEARSENVPVTCVGVEQATAYCGWIGAALPTLAQWLLASRGPDVQRFSWGNDLPTCDQHPLAHGSEGAACSAAKIEVGAHPATASSSGVQDVLLTRGELLATDPDSTFAACSDAYAGCVVRGLSPGAMDAVEPMLAAEGLVTSAPEHANRALLKADPRDARKASTPYGFRCVWKMEGATS